MSSTMFSAMILRTKCAGDNYTWIEKGRSACLTKNGTQLLWCGSPETIPFLKDVPTEVLLEFSVRRKSAASN